MSADFGAHTPIEVVSGKQPLTEAERSLVDEAYSRLLVFKEGCREMHDRAREARQIALIEDPGQDAPGERNRTLQLQTLRSTLNNCIADQMDNMPEAMMLPERPELQEVATDMTDVVRFVLAQNDYESLHRRRAEDYFVTGTSVIQVAWDEEMENGKGNVALLRWPIEALLWDPAAETIQEARAVIKVSWHPLSWYAAHYPENARYVGAEEYSVNDVGVPDAWARKQSGDESRAMMMEYWYRKFDAEEKRYAIHVAYIAGGALLEMSERDRPEGVYRHSMYPFVLDVYSQIEGLPVGKSMVHEYAPMMRYINRYARYVDENLRMASKTRMLVRRDAKIDNEALMDWGKNIIEGANIGEDAVRWLTNAPLPGSATGIMLQFQTDIKQDSGQNQFTRGETAGGVTAASAIAALQEAGGKITRLRTAALNRGFQAIVTQVMWLISEFYTQDRTRMITGRDGKQRKVDMSRQHLFGMPAGFRDLALPPPPYSVQVQVQRRNPMRVQAQNELFIQMYSMAAQSGQPFPLSLLLEMLNVDGKDTVMPVVRQVEAENQVLQQAAAQVEQLAAENQRLQEQVANMTQVIAGQEEVAAGGMYQLDGTAM